MFYGFSSPNFQTLLHFLHLLNQFQKSKEPHKSQEKENSHLRTKFLY